MYFESIFLNRILFPANIILFILRTFSYMDIILFFQSHTVDLRKAQIAQKRFYYHDTQYVQ